MLGALALPLFALLLTQEAMKLSRHPVSGLVLQHPSTWEAIVTASYISVLSPAEDAADLYRENVSIMLQPVTLGTTLAAYAQSSNAALQSSEEGVNELKMTDTTWSNLPAVKFTYTVEREIQGVRRTLRGMQLMRMLYDDVVMISTYSAESTKFEAMLPIASKVNETLTFQPR